MAIKSEGKATSTELTGGAGFTYEDSVVAYYLAALLREEHASGLEGKVVSVAVQRSGHGQPMDDIVVEFEDVAGTRVLGLQVKRALRITSAPSNIDFLGILTAAIATREDERFQKHRDAYGFVAEHTADGPLRSLNRLIDCAKASHDSADFQVRFSDEGAVGAAERKLRADLKPLISPSSAEVEVDFYRHLIALRLDGLAAGGVRHADIVNRLQEVLATDENGHGTLLFDHLCRIVRDGAGSARKWTRNGLLNDLRNIVRLRTVPSYSRDIGTLSAFSAEGLQEVSEMIDGVHVTRVDLQNEITQRLAKYRLVNISGLPGCGKSAVLKHFAAKAMERGPILFLKSDRLVGKSWTAFASTLGLEHSATELLAEVGATGTPILFIDGIDRISPDQKGIVTDLLAYIENHQDFRHWKVLATSRDQGLEPYRAWFPSSFYKNSGVGDVSVGAFSDEESEALANEMPYLRRLLFGALAIREIARRPFFAAILAQNLFADDAAPLTEIDLIDAWWDRAGHDTQPSNRAPRQRALLDLAEAGVSRLGKAIPNRNLRDGTFEQVGGLEADKIIREDGQRGAYSFTHDIFFEWAFFRLLIEMDSEWHVALSAAGEPPLLGRVVSLLAQSRLSFPGRWTTDYRSLETCNLRPQWRREWLTAPPFNPVFPRVVTEFDAMLAQDDGLFEKVLVWFQAQHTLPNPVILQNIGEVADGVDNIRVADLLGWPSDFQSWGRLLDWLTPKARGISVHFIPHVLEVYGVWQNVLAEQRNLRSAAIVEQCSAWLADLEDYEYKDRTFDSDNKWNALSRESRSTLMTGLRTIILRSARSYPESARTLFVRAVANGRMRKAAYRDLMAFTRIMAEVDPEAVIAVAKAELMQELPQDRVDRELRERRERSDWIASIRAKPECELTNEEHRILESQAMYIPVSRRVPDLDDIGIDRHHRYYFHPSALHEPFASLFSLKPQMALALVRDLANHAVRGWRQVHQINRRQMGTPLAVTLEFPWGKQNFWGDWRVYSWSMGQHAPQALECAFLALSYWAFQEIDQRRSTSEIIKAILDGSECYATLGMALMLSLETLEVSETTLPIASCQRLWNHDITRNVQEPLRNLDFLGLGSLTRLSGIQEKAKVYLENRLYRAREVRQLAMMFALNPDEKLRTGFKAALTGFSVALPFELEEQRSSEEVIEELTERATSWAGLGDRDNYQQSPIDTDRVQISYQSPVPLTHAQDKRFADAKARLREQSALAWVMKSLSRNEVADEWKLADALVFACECDTEDIFKIRFDTGLHNAQSAVSAIAACVIAFDSSSGSSREWAWNVMDRVFRMHEPEQFSSSKIPWHPALHLIVALRRDRQTTSPRSDTVERLFRLTSHPLEDIVHTAFQALFLDKDEHVRWTAAQRALDLSLYHAVVLDEDGQRANSVGRAADNQSLANALAKISAIKDEPLTVIPEAWVRSDTGRIRRRGQRVDDGIWDDPNPAFDPQFAEKIFKLFPIADWCQLDGYREFTEAMLLQLVTWTSQRLIPPWKESGKRMDPQSELNEWTSVLGGLLARAVPFLDTVWFKDNLLAPFLTDNDEALCVLSAFTDDVVRLHVMDAAKVPSRILELLEDCCIRTISDRQLASDSYRGGEVSGYELPRLIKALLFVVEDQNCSGSVRFANGDWSEIEVVVPLVTRLVCAVGWSSFVMDRYLKLCERAGPAYPLDAFSVQVKGALDGLANAKGSWAGTLLPARIASAIQRLTDYNYPLRLDQAQALLGILDILVDLGDRRSSALEQAEAFRGVQIV